MTRVDRLILAWASEWSWAEVNQNAPIVAAWKRWPNVFGLEWFEDDHPDAKGGYLDVLRAVKLGLAEWTREKHLRLTGKGRDHADRLIAEEAAATAGRDQWYAVRTFDHDLQKFTPQFGVPELVRGRAGLRDAIRRLRNLGFAAGYSSAKGGDPSVRIERAEAPEGAV